jgi:3-deoxy-D-manno-octulosonic-acid transferase
VSDAATLRERALATAITAAVPLLRVTSRGRGKIGRGVSGRVGAADRLIEWQRGLDARTRPIVWVHAPSVGEGLMAKAIIGALRVRMPDVRVVFTWFSPSAERIAETVGADVADYLPWDTRSEAGRAIAALRPSALACVRTEVWPLLARATHATGGAVSLVNAVLSGSSGRTSAPARWLLAPTYRQLDAVGAVWAEDGPRFQSMGVAPQRIRLTGDARFDQVWQRVNALRANRARLQAMRELAPGGRPIVVAGSTWPADDHTIARAARELTTAPAKPVWILAPHEPTDAHLRALERTLAAHGLSATRMAAAEAGKPVGDALLVDRVGVLADLYAIADIAYVGGGFHRAGLHSVVEPAALGVPVVYGPRQGNAREAEALAVSGGGTQVANADQLFKVLERLMGDVGVRAAAGAAARRFVEDRLGGAERNAALVADLIETRARRQGTV